MARALSGALLRRTIKSFYHTFYQVMSPDRRAYSLKKHLIVHTVLLRPYTLRAISKFAANLWRNDNVQRGFVTTTNNPSTTNQMLFSSWWKDNLMLIMICSASQNSDLRAVNFDS